MNNHSLHPFKRHHFQTDLILLCVRWYLRYALSYRELEEIMLERELKARSYHDLPVGLAVCP